MPFWTSNTDQNVFTPLDQPAPNPDVYTEVRLKYTNGVLQGLSDVGGSLIVPRPFATDVTGLNLGAAVIMSVVPTANSDAIYSVVTNRIEYNSTSYDITGVGHLLGNLNWVVHKTTRTLSLVIPSESKLDNESTGTITAAILNEAQISSNAGTITNAKAYRATVSGNTGTITQFDGFHFPDLSGISGIGLKFAFNNRDAEAPIYSLGPVIDQSIGYASPNATGFTVTVDDYKQIFLLTPAAGYAAGTINMPAKASIYDGQTLELTTTQAVTAVTWGANGAAFVYNGPAGLTAGQTVRFRYFGAIDWWVRI